MLLSPGTRLGPDEVTAVIGSGGMGEVYKPLDTRLGRTVAVKVSANEPSVGLAAEVQAFSRDGSRHVSRGSIRLQRSGQGHVHLKLDGLSGNPCSVRRCVTRGWA
jgi:serine/threonine protein kinase